MRLKYLLQDKADLRLHGIDLVHLEDEALLHGLGQDAFDEHRLLILVDGPVADEVGNAGLAVERGRGGPAA